MIPCKWCSSNCTKAGRQKNDIQKYQCKSCKKYQQKTYIYKAYTPKVHEQFIRMPHLGVPVSKMAAQLPR